MRRQCRSTIHMSRLSYLGPNGPRREGKQWFGINQYSVGQYRLYKVETKLQPQVQALGHDPQVSVYRRYRDFEWLHQALRLRFPACVIPPIPPKNALGKWYNDESEQILKRKLGLQRFLRKVSQHRLVCDSDDLKGFLTEADHAFEDRKRQIQP